MLTAVKAGVEISPMLTVGTGSRAGTASRPSRTGSPCVPGVGEGRPLREPRDQQGAVPVQRAAPTAANGENDFDNAQVSRLVLDRRSADVLKGSFAISSSFGYQRFCSSYLATREGGVQEGDPVHERGVARLRVPAGGVLAAPPGIRPRRRPALSSRSTSRPATTTRSTGWAGTTTRTTSRSPGIDKPVVLSGDDTFTSGPLTDPLNTTVKLGPLSRSSTPTSQPDTKSLLADKGELWAFVSDTPGVKNYYDVAPGSGTRSPGTSSRCRRTSPPASTPTARS